MIKAVIFDLDGTLVQTEKLKADSYARAATELCPYEIQKEDVLEAYSEVVGLSRRKVAKVLIHRFDLLEAAAQRMEEFGVTAPWQAFVQVRLRYYQEMLADPGVIQNHRWPHTLALLKEARQAQCSLGLATMSRCRQARRVLEILELVDCFDFIATRDDVNRGKPDPEIYQLVSTELGVRPGVCLVIEDSPSGVKAAMEAGMQVVAVATPYTQKGLHQLRGFPEGHIVDDPATLREVVADLIRHSEERWFLH